LGRKFFTKLKLSRPNQISGLKWGVGKKGYDNSALITVPFAARKIQAGKIVHLNMCLAL
jgi:hypothetical protein